MRSKVTFKLSSEETEAVNAFMRNLNAGQEKYLTLERVAKQSLFMVISNAYKQSQAEGIANGAHDAETRDAGRNNETSESVSTTDSATLPDSETNRDSEG